MYRGSHKGEKNSFFGKKHSPKSKEKMRKSHLGKKAPWISKLFKGRIPWNKGKRKKEFPQLSNSGVKKGNIPYNKGQKMPETSRENNWRWIEDRMLLKDDYKDRGGQLHREWSKNVKMRDDWKCRINNCDCGGKMVAHHILPWRDFPELRYSLNNGITLCQFHHPHKRAEEQKLIPFFQRMVEVIKT